MAHWHRLRAMREGDLMKRSNNQEVQSMRRRKPKNKLLFDGVLALEVWDLLGYSNPTQCKVCAAAQQERHRKESSDSTNYHWPIFFSAGQQKAAQSFLRHFCRYTTSPWAAKGCGMRHRASQRA